MGWKKMMPTTKLNPSPHLSPAPSEVKWLAHDQTSFIEENPCSSILALEDNTRKQPLNFIILVVSFWDVRL